MLKTLALLTVLHAVPATESISGSWQIRGDIMGNPLNHVCTVTQDGATLSGSCTLQADEPIELTGEVKDGKITFQHGGEYEGQALTIIYTGTLASPEEIRGTVEVRPFSAYGDFTATPVPAEL